MHRRKGGRREFRLVLLAPIAILAVRDAASRRGEHAGRAADRPGSATRLGDARALASRLTLPRDATRARGRAVGLDQKSVPKDNVWITRRSRVTLADLPLFATDREIAEAVVGPTRADSWIRDYLPRLQLMTGFPQFDQSHGGRYTPAVKVFYDQRSGIGTAFEGRDQPEDPGAFRPNRNRRAS